MHEQIGPYRILDSIGRGGMGAVYWAQHQDSGQVVALKTVLLPNRELLQSLRREILALARLRHPGIVQIVAEGVEAGLPWYAMEQVEGVSLGAHAAALREPLNRSEPRTHQAPSNSTATLDRDASALWSEAVGG